MRGRFKPRAMIPVLFWLGLVYGLSRPLGPLPALGPVLNPYSGIWQIPRFSELKDQNWNVAGPKFPVRVLWDEARVPHIQAQNDQDLAWAQGFVHASQRLFQMDLQARAGGARLSALVGPRTLKLDDHYLRIGLRQAVQHSLELMLKDPETKAQVEAYAKGVNAWIKTLKTENLPSEYRLLNQKPELWSPQNVAEFFIVMSYRLAGRTFDLPLTWIQKKYGTAKARSLFPEFYPADTQAPYKDFKPIGLNSVPDTDDKFVTEIDVNLDLIQPFVSNGSNNWAVAPKLSQTGRTLVANDTHLGFSLPGVWFEQQLISPSTNVYGGGFAGAPGVMSGFTPNTAWAVTNGTTDVFDWYEVSFRDDESLEYESLQGWKTASLIEQELEVRGQATRKQKLVWTELGPLFARQGRKGLVSRWTIHDGSDPVGVFRRLNQSKTLQECQSSLDDYRFPIQNFICADRKSISLTHAGLIPIRAPHQGQFVMDAKDPNSRWRGFLSLEQRPHIENPPSGFLTTANQRPVDQKFPVTMGAESENSYRGRQIISELKTKRLWGADDFITLQKNVLNPLAKSVLPKLVPMLKNLDPFEKVVASGLLAWDFTDRLESSESTVFYYWWAQLREAIWSDQLDADRNAVWPRDERLDLLIQKSSAGDNSDAEWIDDISTEPKESLADLVNKSFRQAVAGLKKRHGQSMARWQWSEARKLNVRHIARLPGLGATLTAPGGRHSINAMQTEHGPTWRMVVAIGENVEAWTSAQGNSSGEPFAPSYTKDLEEWSKGLYKMAMFISDRPFESYVGPGRILWQLNPESRP